MTVLEWIFEWGFESILLPWAVNIQTIGSIINISVVKFLSHLQLLFANRKAAFAASTVIGIYFVWRCCGRKTTALRAKDYVIVLTSSRRGMFELAFSSRGVQPHLLLLIA